jgi:hypothetical protein
MSSTNGKHKSHSAHYQSPYAGLTDPLIANRMEEITRNVFEGRQEWLSRYNRINSPGRNVDEECGWALDGDLNAQFYRTLYDRTSIASRICQLYPKECWQITPMIYEDESAKNATPLESAWDNLGKTIKGTRSWYKDEKGSPIWEYLSRADILSGIGTFGVVLLGIGDGKPLHFPVDGAPKDGYPSDATGVWQPTGGDPNRISGVPTEPQGAIKYPNQAKGMAPGGLANPAALYPGGSLPGGIDVYGNPNPYQVGGTLGDWGQTPLNQPDLPFQEIAGTDAQYFQDWLAPQQPNIVPSNGNGKLKNGSSNGGKSAKKNSPKTKGSNANQLADGQKRLLFLRCFDESLVQVVRYEANMYNPRYGQPIMYRITLNDPRQPHTGVGLPLATLYVHWSRVVHLADNLISSEIFGWPRIQPVLNNVLDWRKVMGGSAEMYWQGAFAGLSLETNPQLGGEVMVDKVGLRSMMQDYRNKLQRWIALMGMSAKSLAPQVSDPTPQVEVQIAAICIYLGCPVRVFKGSERGELASTQDDSSWIERLAHRQQTYITPKIIAPFVDRLIMLGVLPLPGSSGDGEYAPGKFITKSSMGIRGNPNGDGMERGNPAGLSAAGSGGAAGTVGDGSMYGYGNEPTTAQYEEDDEEDNGWSCEWPELDATTKSQKATIALQTVQALGAFVAQGVEQVLPLTDLYTKVMGWDEEETAQVVKDTEKAEEQKQQENEDLADKHGFEPEPPEGFQTPEPPPQPPPPTILKPGEKIAPPQAAPNPQQAKVQATAKAQAAQGTKPPIVNSSLVITNAGGGNPNHDELGRFSSSDVHRVAKESHEAAQKEQDDRYMEDAKTMVRLGKGTIEDNYRKQKLPDALVVRAVKSALIKHGIAESKADDFADAYKDALSNGDNTLTAISHVNDIHSSVRQDLIKRVNDASRSRDWDSKKEAEKNLDDKNESLLKEGKVLFHKTLDDLAKKTNSDMAKSYPEVHGYKLKYGNRNVELRYASGLDQFDVPDNEIHSVEINFDSGESNVSVIPKELQSGSIRLAKALKDIVNGLADKGFAIHTHGAEIKRSKLYSKVMRSMGFTPATVQSGRGTDWIKSGNVENRSTDKNTSYLLLKLVNLRQIVAHNQVVNSSLVINSSFQAYQASKNLAEDDLVQNVKGIAMTALDYAREGNNNEAAEHHLDAARQHREAAEKHDLAAQLLTNSNPEGINQYTKNGAKSKTRDADEASQEALRASDSYKNPRIEDYKISTADKASALSKSAKSWMAINGPGHRSVSGEHAEASSMHSKAAKEEKDKGHKDAAKLHGIASKLHNDASQYHSQKLVSNTLIDNTGNPNHDELGRFAVGIDKMKPLSFHGTSAQFLESIKEKGLVASQGPFKLSVHASKSYHEAMQYGIGKSSGPQAKLAILTIKQKASSVGFRSEHKMFDHVPPENIVRVDVYSAVEAKKFLSKWIKSYGNKDITRDDISHLVKNEYECYIPVLIEEPTTNTGNPNHDELGRFSSGDSSSKNDKIAALHKTKAYLEKNIQAGKATPHQIAKHGKTVEQLTKLGALDPKRESDKPGPFPSSIKDEAHIPPPPGKAYTPNVESTGAEGVTKAARIGVPANSVPPPPEIPLLPNLTPRERHVEKDFKEAYEKDPDGMATEFRTKIVPANTKPGDPPTFGTDDAKVLSKYWDNDKLSMSKRSENRASLNCALHQTANAITKRAFLQHLDTLKEGDGIMVTVGGCGCGKGFSLSVDDKTGEPRVPEAYKLKKESKAVWDSAGDQNATENKWIQSEAEKRGLKVTYAFAHADPHVQWAHPSMGVVQRAGNPKDGRMVDAEVFADSYAIGAENHQKFYEANKDNPNAKFIFMAAGKKIDGIPKEALGLDRKELAEWAKKTIREGDAPAHVKRGGLIGDRIWKKDN